MQNKQLKMFGHLTTISDERPKKKRWQSRKLQKKLRGILRKTRNNMIEKILKEVKLTRKERIELSTNTTERLYILLFLIILLPTPFIVNKFLIIYIKF